MDCSQRQTATASNILSNQTKPIQTNQPKSAQAKQIGALYVHRQRTVMHIQLKPCLPGQAIRQQNFDKYVYSNCQKYAASQILLQIRNPFLTAVFSILKMNIFHNHATLIIQGGFHTSIFTTITEQSNTQNKKNLCSYGDDL